MRATNKNGRIFTALYVAGRIEGINLIDLQKAHIS